jgi:hypothetical protein
MALWQYTLYMKGRGHNVLFFNLPSGIEI